MHHEQFTALHLPQEDWSRYSVELFARLHVACPPCWVVRLLLICNMNKATSCGVCLKCSLPVPLWIKGAMWHFPPPEEDLFECDIEKSLEADFALSGTLIHTRWVFFFFFLILLLKRKPDTKGRDEIIKMQSRAPHMWAGPCRSFCVCFRSRLVIGKMERQKRNN